MYIERLRHRMNNKKLGTKFERTMCDILKRDGWWVHFMSPDERGAQPFDIIAVRGCEVVAADCKTSAVPIFRRDRLEDNQKSAFDHWIRRTDFEPAIFVKYQDCVYKIPYVRLIFMGSIDLRKEKPTWKIEK